ncbi:MAG TPA: sigma-70 family RNA polymerase sigma factor [Pyrinomonadaceae bacterium]|nr:sigma-70 family RNA polymerase sigma factor [Pyrinomonadaceae bacterium]
MNGKKESDGSFESFFQNFLDGLGSNEDLVAHAEFERWMRIYSHKYYCHAPGWIFSPDDLYSEARKKVLGKVQRLSRENTPNARAFIRWLKTLVRNTFLDELRKFKRRGGVLEQIEIQVEILDVPAPDENPEAKYFLNLFLKFIEIYSGTRRAALMLWLQSYSYREIAKNLVVSNGNAISHVTVRNWVIASLADFRKHIGLHSPKRDTGKSSTGKSARATSSSNDPSVQGGQNDEYKCN